jgi:hypothetical protein
VKQALAMLLGKNQYTNELPATRYILNKLQPQGIFNKFLSSPITDEQLTAALWLIQMCIIKKEVVTLDDFDAPTQEIIKATPAFSATLDFCNKNENIKTLLNNFLTPVLSNIVMDYRGCRL